MSLPITRHWLIWLAAASFFAALLMLMWPARGSALPAYSTATGQPCTACHVNASGTGGLTATGQAFAAIPTHASDPAGAFAQVRGAAAPAAPTAAPAAPAATAAPAAPAATRAPAAAAATPAALPSSGEASTDATLPAMLAILGFFALGAGLTFSFREARNR